MYSVSVFVYPSVITVSFFGIFTLVVSVLVYLISFLKLSEGTMPVNVVEDYTQRVREERKRLVPHMLELRRSQPTVKTYIKYDKLVSGRDTFTLDENNRLMKVGNGSR